MLSHDPCCTQRSLQSRATDSAAGKACLNPKPCMESAGKLQGSYLRPQQSLQGGAAHRGQAGRILDHGPQQFGCCAGSLQACRGAGPPLPALPLQQSACSSSAVFEIRANDTGCRVAASESQGMLVQLLCSTCC